MNVVLDENLPPRWRDYLDLFGVSATHWRDIGNIGDPDEKLFDYACKRHAVIVTQDLDFARLLAQRGVNSPSVIQIRVDCPIPKRIGEILVKILKNYRDALRDGCLISVDRRGHRLRLLPLKS